LAVKGEL